MIGTMTKWRNRSCGDWRTSVLEFFGLSDELLALFGRREVFHSENSINIVDMLSHGASLPKEQLDLRRVELRYRLCRSQRQPADRPIVE